ncbi:MAG: c-type cytochrome [Gammaproteobacteria bacterium]|nr:c-type cytochrome [Gammaproteobacteria bacterium]MBQ0838552.1 c-type cytochrome [Gammaproteobacteria bacterium]
MSNIKRSLLSVIVAFAIAPILITSQAQAADKASIEQGARIYAQSCAVCHQADAIGKPGFAPSLSNPEFLSVASDRFILATMLGGRPGTGMPSFAYLGADKGKAVLAYLRSFATLPDRSVAIDAEPASQGDVRRGKESFDLICSTCHGRKGDGYIAGGTGTAIGRAGTISHASDGFLRATIKDGRSNTRMLGFSGPDGMANLSDQEIDDIIVYLHLLADNEGS